MKYKLKQYTWNPWEAINSYLIVKVEVVKLSIGTKVPSVMVQGKVDISSVALNDNWVPVMIIQQAATAYRCVTQDGTVLVAACLSQKKQYPAFTL